MLIYNFEKEFIGMDEADLMALGFTNLEELRAESEDFANLFIKTPGYIHNFKHVHWIDFVMCDEGNENPKVIIHAKNKSYRCTLDIKPMFLVDNPSQNAYLVNLKNLRALTNEENAQISGDISQRIIPKAAAGATQILNKSGINSNIQTPNPIPTIKQENKIVEIEENLEPQQILHDPYSSENHIIDEFDNPALHVETDSIDINLNDDKPIEISFDDEEVVKIEEKKEPILKVEDSINIELEPTSEPIKSSLELDLEIDEIQLNNEVIVEDKVKVEKVEEIEEDDELEMSDYIYDPLIASDELGLPIDLIEEFIEDFIAQAKEFKADLYDSLDTGNLEQVAKLSHMLKGVAANLRIEDARETLIIINTSKDINEIKLNLNLFYKIIAKLAHEEIPVKKKKIVEETPKQVDKVETDDLMLSLDEVDKVETDDLMLSLDEEISINENLELEEEIVLEVDKEENQDELLLSLEDEVIEIEENRDIASKIDDKEDDLLMIDLDEDNSLDMINIDENSEDIIYDREKAAQKIGLDLDSFNELFDDFIIESKALCDDIAISIEKNDVQKWQQYGVKLKSMNESMNIDSYMNELINIISSDDSQVVKVALDKINQTILKIGNK